MNNKIIKKLLLIPFFFFSFVSVSQVSTSIRSIANLAGCKMIISNRLKCSSVDPYSTKNFNHSFDIPFVSIKQHLKEFVKDIPYVPHTTLKVITKAGIFHIWKNESGIVYAPDPSHPEAVAAWKLRVLLDKINNNNVNLANLALEIDKDGNLDMKQRIE